MKPTGTDTEIEREHLYRLQTAIVDCIERARGTASWHLVTYALLRTAARVVAANTCFRCRAFEEEKTQAVLSLVQGVMHWETGVNHACRGGEEPVTAADCEVIPFPRDDDGPPPVS